ncbi:DMT family transporter [Pseudoxanthomonas winnipegensis]|uniref:Transporter n=1 Tax=Pseudoxanthomonas winnipegensis TaxID=2480810 RepID=A0A4Q8LSV3_9GAMM|nr:DMT family transporter [Pseudoxanthomonas winnipegensis]RZZ84769.1 transporter [Pseudoxanthomonas winnipegensis]RZZ86079.1 transporter [Pseudoxanthomonas winnipegensis]TAA31217.1 transporter [Pseudoxanthomonas winnipegensis]TAA33710.1 transporter [Pseudoxanthomonas winnipegensis]TBV77480.1 transporter [Pseudoxanthomonas winnipegensis]
MSPGTVAMVLGAAGAHAVWNLASKSKRGDAFLFVWAYTWASTLLFVPLGIAMAIRDQQPFDARLVVASVLSAGLHTAYSLTLQAGYDRAALGVVYPVARATGPMLTMGFAVLVLGERLTPVAVLGALLIVAGILVVIGNPFRTGSRHALPGMLWGGATGAAIAAYTLWDSYAVTTWRLAPASYYAGTLLLQGLIMMPLALRRRQRLAATLRSDARPILVVALFSPLAYLLVLTAMQRAPVALVAPLRESSIVIGALLACLLFGEDHLARRVTGAVVVLAGIAAIGF